MSHFLSLAFIMSINQQNSLPLIKYLASCFNDYYSPNTLEDYGKFLSKKAKYINLIISLYMFNKKIHSLMFFW